MGIGDEILATGQVRKLREAQKCKVRILDRFGRPRWHEVWEGNPSIIRGWEPANGKVCFLRNGPGMRPYLDQLRSTQQRWVYTNWQAIPGELFGIEPDPRGFGRILIEPELKGIASPNKQWGRWADLVKANYPWAQMCPPGQPALRGVERIETRTFKEACGVLLAARGMVLPEGGLHHAAAALEKRAVVLFGAYIRPLNTGYGIHENLAVHDPEGLGWRIPNAACKRAWEQITSELVLSHLEKTLA